MHGSPVIYYYFCLQTVLGEIHSQHHIHILVITFFWTNSVAVHLIFVSFSPFPNSFVLETTSGICCVSETYSDFSPEDQLQQYV